MKRLKRPKRRPTGRPAKEGVVRTTISLAPAVQDMAHELMAELKFDNFSGFLEHLIREEVKRQQSDTNTSQVPEFQ